MTEQTEWLVILAVAVVMVAGCAVAYWLNERSRPR